MEVGFVAMSIALEQDAVGTERQRRARTVHVVIIFVVLAVMLALLLASAMTKRLDHDEEQFVASGVLLARRGLLPYHDYPYFHVPYLVYVYAALTRLSDHLLLIMRLFNALCGFATAAIVFFM